MNKQQLASKIWASANKMRSKIEAGEYKDYILGFVFYKFLSEKEEQFLKANDFSDNDIAKLTEEKDAVKKFVQQNLGYFIAYDNLFSTWLKMKKAFGVSNVRDALNAFDRLIHPSHKKVFKGIFDTLGIGLSKLGDSTGNQTKAISELLNLIKDIPMDGKEGYDVLGFIYEYLISMFAQNAGKKAGEFYTPHEASVLMSEIIADHLKDRKEIKIYDPTSGSGSLLINIGQIVGRNIDNKNNIKYFAQEWKENTYNLTRMNLVMRDILPANIEVRNGDTLESDWPYFDESDPIGTYNPLYLDAVVSNPPYSQAWEPSDKESDPRFKEYGLAPKGKADYAFLLHDLYHLKPDGIMTIVLPHGVLFRGGEEGEIRKNLIEKNNIDAIIGLPANMFFGTGIPTIIMVLKQKKENSDVLIIDASKGFEKAGTKNKLRSSDIKKIVDTVIERKSIDKFSRLVSRQEIRDNDYNLNIPRYVDSSEPAESWDIYATMFGGIPKSELELLHNYWEAFKGLKEELFHDEGTPYVSVVSDNIKEIIANNAEVINFKANYTERFADFESYLVNELIKKINDVEISKEEIVIAKDLFERLENIDLVDKYAAYQVLDDNWNVIATDLEMIQTEGFECTKQVDPRMVIKKKDNEEVEVQDGHIGHIIPFELIYKTKLQAETDAIKEKENRLSEIASELEEILESLSEEEKDSAVTNDDGSAFVAKEVDRLIKEALLSVETDEIKCLNKYLELLDNKAKKPEKLAFIANNTSVNWNNIESNKDGTYGKTNVNKYIKVLQSEFKFEEDTFESKLTAVSDLFAEEKTVKADLKVAIAERDAKTIEIIEHLSDEEVYDLLVEKWIIPMVSAISELPNTIIKEFIKKIEHLEKKYATTYFDIADQIRKAKTELSGMIDELTGSEFDMKGLSGFKSLLGGQNE